MSSWDPPDTPRTWVKLPPAPPSPTVHAVHGHIVCSLWKPFLKQQNPIKKNESKSYQNKALAAQTILSLGKEEAWRGPKANHRRPGVSPRRKVPIEFLIIVLIGVM